MAVPLKIFLKLKLFNILSVAVHYHKKIAICAHFIFSFSMQRDPEKIVGKTRSPTIN